MTVLSILFRRSLLLWAIPIWAGLYATGILNQDAPWRGDPAWGIEVVGVFVMFSGTVLTAMVAWETASRDGHLSALTTMAGRGRWHLVLRVAVGWGLALGVYLCAVLIVVLVSGFSPLAVNDVSPLPLMTGALALLAAAAWGALIGRRVGGVMAPVVAGISFLALEYLDYAGLVPLGLAEQGATSTLLGVRYSLAHFFVRVAWLAAFICFCLMLAETSKTWVRGVRGTCVVALIALTVGTAALPTGVTEAYVVDRKLDASACTGSAVTICVIPQWSSRLTALESVARGTQTALQRETSVALKPKYIGWTPSADFSTNTVDVVSPDYASRPAGVADVVQDLLAPLGCRDWHNPDVIPPDQAFAGRELLTEWILAQPELASFVAGNRKIPSALADLSSQEIEAYLTKVATGLMDCDLAGIPAAPGS